MNAIESLRWFLPETFLTLGAFFVLLADLFSANKKTTGVLSLAVLAGAALLCRMPEGPQPLFFGFYMLDPLTHYFRMAALGMTFITVLIALSYRGLSREQEGEFYSLLLFMTLGLILMAGSTNLLAIFLSIEFVSVLSYLLTGFLKKDGRSKEAAVKYLLVGSLASGVMLYGMSLLFGASGSLDLSEIQLVLANKSAFYAVSLASFLMISAGIGFKISMAPFHLWAPDAYEAAPTPFTAFLTVGPKAMGFAVFIRVLSSAFAWINFKWMPLIVVLSIVTMTLGNVIAIAQNNVKRLLAYSSIAQAGYILMGLAAFNSIGLEGILIYLAAYAFTNLGAFTAVIMVTNITGSDDLASFTGLGRRAPFVAASLTVFLLSLAGIPPLAGFVAKFFVFSSAIQANLNWLAIAAAVNSAVAAFYYFRIVRLMYLVPCEDTAPVRQPAPLMLALVLMLAGTILLGLMPSPLINLARSVLV